MASRMTAADASPGAGGHPAGPTRDRLEDQVDWYDRKSASNQRMFKRLKVLQLVAGAMVPVAASVNAAAWITGGLGALVVVESIQQLGQYQQNWTNYRSTCEALKHEKYLCLAEAGHYHASGNPERMLAERIEGLVSQEHAKWTLHERKTRHTRRGAPGRAEHDARPDRDALGGRARRACACRSSRLASDGGPGGWRLASAGRSPATNVLRRASKVANSIATSVGAAVRHFICRPPRKEAGAFD
jgi:hypothetical protein